MNPKLQNTRKTNYSRIADVYDQNAFLHSQIGEELLSRLDLIKIDISKVLDLGCGTGQHIKQLNTRFPKSRLHFVDNNPEMLALAKKQKSIFKKYKFHCENANSLSFEDNMFDCVISNLMLQDCLEPDAIFSEVQRVSRENGLFTFSTLGPDSFKELRSAVINAEINLEAHAFGHLTDMHDIGDALLRSGLREPVLDVDTHVLEFKNFSHLFNELDSIGHILQTFTEAEIAQISRHYPNPSKVFNLTVEVVYGQAWAGDGKSKSRSPQEFHFPLDKLIQRKN